MSRIRRYQLHIEYSFEPNLASKYNFDIPNGKRVIGSKQSYGESKGIRSSVISGDLPIFGIPSSSMIPQKLLRFTRIPNHQSTKITKSCSESVCGRFCHIATCSMKKRNAHRGRLRCWKTRLEFRERRWHHF